MKFGIGLLMSLCLAVAGCRMGPATPPTDSAPHVERGSEPDLADHPKPIVCFASRQELPNRIVYLCDASGSMMLVFDELRIEMRKSIAKLIVIQSFNIVFFSGDEAIMLDKDGPIPATPKNKAKAFEFLDEIAPRGSGNPFPAIKAAFAGRPDLIYCVTNGLAFPDDLEAVAEAFRKPNTDRKVTVNTLLIASEEDPQLSGIMRKIADENGGKFKQLTSDGLQEVPPGPNTRPVENPKSE